MSLELLNTGATLLTCIVVGATAIAALIQLRHLRASNQIEGQLAINNLMQSDEFLNALMTLQGLPKMLEDRSTIAAFHAPLSDALPKNIVEMRRAAKLVGSNLENIGNMVRHRLTDEGLFIEQFGNVVEEAWELLLPYTMIRRTYDAAHDAIWEDLEYLTLLARKWRQTQGSAFPRGMKRILPPYTEFDVPEEPLGRS